MSSKLSGWNNGTRAPIRVKLGGSNGRNGKGSPRDDSKGALVAGHPSRLNTELESPDHDIQEDVISPIPTRQALEEDGTDDMVLTYSKSDLIDNDGTTASIVRSTELPGQIASAEILPDSALPARPELSSYRQNGSSDNPPPKETLLSELPNAYKELQSLYFMERKLSPSHDEVDKTIICLVCRTPGHIGNDCPRLTCSACGAYKQHFIAACPQRVVCIRCNHRGHRHTEYQSKLKAAVSAGEAECFVCSSDSHSGAECPGVWQTYKPELLLKLLKVDSLPTFCYSCGARGHLGADCSSRPMGWKPPKSGDTFTYAGARRYVRNESQLMAPQRTPAVTNKQRQDVEYISSDDSEFAPPVSRAAPDRRRGNPNRPINIKPSHSLPRRPHSPGRADSYPSNRGRNHRAPPGSFRSQDHGITSDHFRTPLPSGPPPGRARPPSRGARGRGRGTSGGGSYRPMPSAGAKAWRQHRI